MKCLVCNQQTTPGRTLCYLHEKYKSGLTGPYYETLYDLAWAKATFIPAWDEKVGTKLLITCDDRVNEQKMDKQLWAKVVAQVQQELSTHDIDIDKYHALMLKHSIRFAQSQDKDVDAMYNKLWLYLYRTATSNQSEFEGPQNTIYIERRIKGFFINLLNREVTPEQNRASDVEVETQTTEPTQSDKLERVQLYKELGSIYKHMRSALNDVQYRAFLYMYVINKSMTVTELSNTLQLSRRHTHRVINKINTILEALNADV